jgi:hypothetical protein
MPQIFVLGSIVPFSALTLKKTLFPDLVAAENAAPVVKQTLTGPAQINGWDLAEGAAAFIQPEEIQLTSKRGIIIFSAATLASYVPSKYEIQLIECLLHSDLFEVYVYPGQDVKFDSYTRVTSWASFLKWEEPSEMADAETVKKTLARQGVDLKYIAVIDKNIFERLHCNNREHFHYLNQEDEQKPPFLQFPDSPQLSQFSEQIQAAEGIKLLNFSKSVMDFRASIRLRDFESVNCLGNDVQFMPDSLFYLDIKGSQAICEPIIQAQKQLRYLSYNADISHRLDLSSHALLSRLDLQGADLDLHFSEQNSLLRSLFISVNDGEQKTVSFDLRALSQLRELEISYSPGGELHLDLSGLQELRSIRIYSYSAALHLKMSDPLPSHLIKINVSAKKIVTDHSLCFSAETSVNWDDGEKSTLAGTYARSSYGYFSIDHTFSMRVPGREALYTYPIAQGECAVQVSGIGERDFRTRLIHNVHLAPDGQSLIYDQEPQPEHLVMIANAPNGVMPTDLASRFGFRGMGFKGEMKQGKLYPLTIYAPRANRPVLGRDFNISTNVANAITVLWDRIHYQYYCRLNPQVPDNTYIEMMYQCRESNTYHDYQKLIKQEDASLLYYPDGLLDKELQTRLVSLCMKIRALEPLFDKFLTWEEKLAILQRYCEGFRRDVIPQEYKDDALGALFYSIEHRVGLHDHIIQSLFVLARMIGIPANIRIGAHTLALELAFTIGGVNQWIYLPVTNKTPVRMLPPSNVEFANKTSTYNVSARALTAEEQARLNPPSSTASSSSSSSWTAAYWDHESLVHQQEEQAFLLKSLRSLYAKREAWFNTSVMPEMSLEDKAKLRQARELREAEQKVRQAHFDAYGAIFDKLLTTQPLNAIADLITQQFTCTPLVQIDSETTLYRLERELFEAYCVQHSDGTIVLIHNTQELQKYLAPWVIANGVRKQMTGPLAEIMKQGGLIGLSWNGFNPAELTTYKSVSDQSPTLSGNALHANTQVVGFATPQLEVSEAFTSRMQALKVNSGLIPQTGARSSSTKSMVIDLDFKPDWKTTLFGELRFQGHHINWLEPEEHTDVMKILYSEESLCVTIINPPNQESFKAWLAQIEREGRFFHQGKFHTVPKHIVFRTENKPMPALSRDNIVIEKAQTQNVDKDTIPLNAYNWHELFRRDVVDVAHHAVNTQPGFLRANATFYVTGKIPAYLWRQLLKARIEGDLVDYPCTFILAPGAEIESVEHNFIQAEAFSLREDEEHQEEVLVDVHSVVANQVADDARMILTNDPDYLAKQLAETHHAVIHDVHPGHTFSDLFYEVSYKEDLENPGQFLFEYKQKPLLNDLLAGKPIILNGDISPILYEQIAGLFISPPRFYVNGQWKFDPKPNVHFVLPLSARSKFALLHSKEQIIDDNAYLEAFPEHQEQITKLQLFMTYVNKISHKGIGMPPVPQLTHARYKNLVRALSPGYERHSHNPIKGFFHYHYPKNSEAYAYLSVVSKRLFRPEDDTPVDEARLTAVIKKVRPLSAYTWRILNCLRGKQLMNFLQEADLSLQDPGTLMNKVLEELVTPRLHIDSPPREKAHLAKRERELTAFLAESEGVIGFIKGEAGSGKTSTVERMQKQFPQVHLKDELNLEPNGKHDDLKAADRVGVSISGKQLATGNVESYPGRHRHRVLEDHAELFYFKMPENEELSAQILEPILKEKLGEEFDKVSQTLLFSFRLAQRHQPTHEYTMRDLQSLAERVLFVLEKKSLSKALLYKLCLEEFAAGIFDRHARHKFIIHLHSLIDPQKAFPIAGFVPDPLMNPSRMKRFSVEGRSFYWPQDRMYVYDKIVHDIDLRERAIQKGTYYKRGILSEGEPGLGKSTLYKVILEARGYVRADKAGPNTPKHKIYYEVSAGDDAAREIVIRALTIEGAAVILDEPNADPGLEFILNPLMEGRGLNGEPLPPGGMLFASQNFSYGKGLVATSPALRSRMDMIYMDTYSKDDLEMIAELERVPCPAQFTTAFYRSMNGKPQQRTFFKAIPAAREQGAIFAAQQHREREATTHVEALLAIDLPSEERVTMSEREMSSSMQGSLSLNLPELYEAFYEQSDDEKSDSDDVEMQPLLGPLLRRRR